MINISKTLAINRLVFGAVGILIGYMLIDTGNSLETDEEILKRFPNTDPKDISLLKQIVLPITIFGAFLALFGAYQISVGLTIGRKICKCGHSKLLHDHFTGCKVKQCFCKQFERKEK